MQKIFYSILLLSLSFQALSASPGLVADVGLSLGSPFQIVSKEIKGQAVKVGDKLLAKDIKIPVAPFTTDNDLRDKHLKEKLESSKYAFIIVKMAKAVKEKGTALLSIKNKEKKVPFTYEEESGNLLKVKFSISLKAFGFEEISYGPVYVKDEVNVEAYIPYKTKK